MKRAFTGVIQVEVDKGVDLLTAVQEAKELLYTTKADKIVFQFNGIWVEADRDQWVVDIIAEYYSNFENETLDQFVNYKED